jgi:hypothetical protein
MKSIAILQSNYIPWRGYFDIINSVNEFVIYDDAQYTKRDWRNRNLIKTRNGLQWLTIPVKSKGRYLQKICETEIADDTWADKHLEAIRYNYKAAKYFDYFEGILKLTYQEAKNLKFLSEVNKLFIDKINSILGIDTPLSYSSDYDYCGNNTEKVISICKQAGAEEYFTGPTAIDYLDTGKFEKSEIKIHWIDYSGYPEYRQLYNSFELKVSIIDLIINEGPKSTSFMKSF